MDLKKFTEQKLDVTNTTVFDSGWVKTERTQKASGSTELKKAVQLFNANQEGMASHAERLIKVSQECLYKGIELVRPGVRLGDIGHVIQAHAEANYYSVVRDYCGHGIGPEFHQEPQILHYGKPDTGLELVEGMTFTIEPMVNAGKHQTKLKADGWTVETRDGRLSSQWEHTMLVTATGVEVFTARGEESF